MIENYTEPEIPKGDIIVSCVAVVVLLLLYLCILLMGYGSNTAFLCMPLIFLSSIGLVIAAVIQLIVRMYKYWVRYSVGGIILRTFFLIVLLSLTVSYPKGARYLPVLGIRLHVEATGGLDELQEWAIGILDQPEEVVLKGDPNHIKRIKPELYSEQVRKLSPGTVILIQDDGNEPCLQIAKGGGFVSIWGIKVGRPTYEVYGRRSMRLYKWRNGVYGFSL
jgi:hypothetical protein